MCSDSTKIYDFFISYKSEDIDIVRQVADRLLASKLEIWFAEYKVLLQARDQFQSAIDQGVCQSRYGIIFTNDRYVNSKYCRIELEGLLKPENCGVDRIIEIKLDNSPLPHNTYPDLTHAHSITFEDNLAEVLHFIEDVTSLPLRRPPELPLPSDEPFILRDERLGYQLSLAGWHMYTQGKLNPTFGGFWGPAFQRQIGDGMSLRLYISAGMAAVTRTTHKVQGLSAACVRRALKAAAQNLPNPILVLDDRKCYEGAMDFASAYLDQQCKGVHLFFFGGMSQLALTYTASDGWKRRYSIVLVDPVSQLSIELAIAFKFVGSFTEYCHYTTYMDTLVKLLCVLPNQESAQEATFVIREPVATYEHSWAIKQLPPPVIAQANVLFEKAARAEGGLLRMFYWSSFKKIIGDRPYKQAIQLYEKVLKEEPDCAKVHCAFGILLARIGRNQEALQHFLTADELHPGNAWVHANLACCYEELGEFKRASQFLELAQAQRERERRKEATQLTNLAYQDVERRDFKSARTKLEQALELAQDLPDTHNEYATVLGFFGESQKAREQIECAIWLDPNNPKFWMCLSRWYYDHRCFPQASKAILVAEEIDPNYPTIQVARLHISQALGDSQTRSEAYRKKARELYEMRGRRADGTPFRPGDIDKILSD